MKSTNRDSEPQRFLVYCVTSEKDVIFDVSGLSYESYGGILN